MLRQSLYIKMQQFQIQKVANNTDKSNQTKVTLKI